MTGGTGSGGTGAGQGGGQDNRGDDGAIAWRLHGFDHAGNRYGFETARSGDKARVVVNGRTALELPAIVWDAILGAVELQRRTANGAVPATAHASAPTPTATTALYAPTLERTGSAWDTAEDEQLRAGWIAKRTVGELAVQHRRSRSAITGRLRLLGLIEVDPLMAASVAEPLAH